jgi:hypothetical protein
LRVSAWRETVKILAIDRYYPQRVSIGKKYPTTEAKFYIKDALYCHPQSRLHQDYSQNAGTAEDLQTISTLMTEARCSKQETLSIRDISCKTSNGSKSCLFLCPGKDCVKVFYFETPFAKHWEKEHNSEGTKEHALNKSSVLEWTLESAETVVEDIDQKETHFEVITDSKKVYFGLNQKPSEEEPLLRKKTKKIRVEHEPLPSQKMEMEPINSHS